MRPQPYIGITGVSTRGEAQSIIDYLPHVSAPLVMVGVLASRKSVRGIPVDQPKRYPAREALSDIFIPHERVLNLLHFNSREPADLLEDIELALSLAGPYCQGFQLNMKEPGLDACRQYKAAHPSHTLIIQFGPSILKKDDDAWLSADELADRAEAYCGTADYVLIDMSAGKGIAFDFQIAKNYFAKLEGIPGLGFGIGGGLGPKTLHRLYPIWKEFDDFSIDAESGVRDDRDDYSAWRASTYLAAASVIFRVRNKQRIAA